MNNIEEFYICHKNIFDYGIRSNVNINVKNPNSMAGGAIFKLTALSLCLHRGIERLCSYGWARITPPLIRTMMDILINVLVIANDRESDYMAFKYYVFDYIKADKVLNENSITESSKIQIDKLLYRLTKDKKNEALEWMKNKREKHGIYWYADQYKGPKAVLRKLTRKESDMEFSYDRFSGFAHGGHIDSGFFQDNPDEIDINPKLADFRSIMMALSSSSRFLLETLRVRNIFEKAFNEREFNALLLEMVKLKPVLEKTIKRK